MVFGKSEYNKATRDDKKDARKDARAEKKDARKDARAEKKDARQDARAEKKDARVEKREEKKDARQDKREALKAIRKSDLKGEEKRDAKRDARQDKRDVVYGARTEARAEKKGAERKKDRKIDQAEHEKDRRVEAAREEKKEALDALKVPKAFDRTWHSYLKFQRVRAVEIFKPGDLAELRSILRVAGELGLKVRAIGSGHSFSDIGVTDGFFVLTQQLDRLLPLGPAARRRRFKAPHHDNDRLVETEVGIRVYPLSQALEKRGLALGNQGTYDGQTLWGVVSTSTHGTGVKRGPFPDMVRSVVMVGEGGVVRRIEPKNGITDPQGWKEEGVDQLLQDDEVFYSVICSMGCMGVAYSVIIEARPMYWIDEWQYLTTWEDFKAEFPTVEALNVLLEKYEMVSFLVSPIATDRKRDKEGVEVRGRHPCSIMIREETRERRTIGGTSHADIARFIESHHGMDWKHAYDSKTALLPKLSKDLAHSAVYAFGKEEWPGLAADPTQPAPYRRNRCYEIFPQGGKIFGGFASELAFPRRDFFRIMDRIIEIAEESQEEGDTHSAPIALRLVAPSKAYASPQYGRDTVMFEVLMTKGTRHGREMVEKVEQTLLEEEAGPDRDAEDIMRLHWGLQMSLMQADGQAQLRRMYPKWDAWMRTYAKLNAQGTFNNTFTDRLGISRGGGNSGSTGRR